MSIHIDPKALKTISGAARTQSADLRTVHLDIFLPEKILGDFGEATALVSKVNAHTAEVNQRLQATSDALLDLAKAAGMAAALSDASDADIAKQMKAINAKVDEARWKLIAPRV